MARQHLATQRIEIRRQRGIAGHRTRAHQRLVFPGPGAFALVLGKTGQARHQQSFRAIRAQAHVDLEQSAGAGAGAEQGDDLLPEPGEPARRIHRPRAVGLRVRRRVVQEHQVEVGAEAEFLATKAAVAEHGEARTNDPAMCSVHLVGRDAQHAGDHRIGQPGQPLRTILRVATRIEQGQRDAEAQGLPHLVERMQRSLGIALAQGRHAFGLYRVAIRQAAGDAPVQQFIQQ